MGKRKRAKPLLGVQGIVHLTESFVQPSQESGLLNTVGGVNAECAGLILAPNYGYAISASSLAKKAEEEAAEAQKQAEESATDTENIENETPEKTDTDEESVSEEPDLTDLSVAELVRHIGGAKDKPLQRRDVVEDRPESELPQKPVEEDDPETAKFYESLGISRPSASKEPSANTVKNAADGITNEDSSSPEVVEVEDPETSVPESVAEYYKNYPTEYVYSVRPDPYGNQPLEFSLPTAPYQEEITDSNYSIIEVARRAQRAKRDYEAKKAALERKKAKEGTTVEEEEPYDPLPMEIVPSDKLTGPRVRPEESNLNIYWEYVQENPHDFNRWSFLISYAENTSLLNEIRKVYSAFLPLFPYCFGYWKRYSDIEKAHNYFQRALTILQRGLEFIPLSMDLWMSYLALFAEIHAHNKDFEEILRQQYEFGINSCGMEFRSDTLWDSYIQWEMNLKKANHAFLLYKRLLQVPTRLYNRHWDNCKILIRDYHPRDFLSYDDYESIRKKGCRVLAFRYKPEPEIEAGEIRKTRKPEDKLMDYVKERVLEKLTKIQAHTALETDKRWDFEDKIKRPYFHVKPLDKGQLWNWEEYLNFEIKQGNYDRIVLLFERCLVACANYERYWCKYARYIEKYHRQNPELESSAHLQLSKVHVEIVSNKATEEEEEMISTVEAILSSLVSTIVEEEELVTEAVLDAMETMLVQLDDDPESSSRRSISSVLDESASDPMNLRGHSENKTAELPQDSGANELSSSDFAALLRIPIFPPASHRWHEVLRDIYKRASLIHCPRKPTIRLQWAAFEEEIGNIKESRELIAYVMEWYPNFLEAKLQLLDLERRTGMKETVVTLYEDYIKNAKSKEVISLLSMKYARFLFKEMGFPDKALKVLRTALKKDSGNHRLYAQVYEICYHRFPADRKGAFAALELATRAEKLTSEQKLIFARKRVHFFQEHSDLERYRNALDDLYELESVVRQKEVEEKKWREFEARLEAQKSEEVTRSLQPFPVPTGQKPPQEPVGIVFDSLKQNGEIEKTTLHTLGSTDVGPSLPYSAVPPVEEYLDANYGYCSKHPDAKLAEHLGHKQYESIESKGYPETIKDTPEDLEALRERKRKNPLYIVPPRGSFYINSDTEVPGGAKRLRLEAPVLLSELITPNSSPCVNVPDWFVKEGGELCLSETVHGFSILRYWPHFLSEDGNMKMFKSLRKSVKWHQKQILTSYGTWRHIPRLVSWLGPCEYAHTGLVLPKCEDWTPEILDLLHRLVQLVNYEFNSCSLNLYRTGHDSNAWHADIHPALGSNPPIASVSLGALRTFEMKRKGVNSTNFIRFPLFPGSLLIMEGATQADWIHQVPKEPATKTERLNLTFRIMHALEDDDPFASKEKAKMAEGKENGSEGGTIGEKLMEISGTSVVPPPPPGSKEGSKNEAAKKPGSKEGSKSEAAKNEIDPLLLATFPEKEKPTEKPKEPPKPWEVQTKIRFRN